MLKRSTGMVVACCSPQFQNLKKNMKASTLSLLGAAVLAGSSAMATSIPINGTIDFAGGFSLADSSNNTTSDFTVATKFSTFDNVHVDHNGTGAYSAVPALT